MAEPYDDPQDIDDNAYALDGDVIEAIRDAVEAGDRSAMLALLEDLHAADIADLLEQIGAGERRDFLTLWHKDLDGEVLSELSDRVRDEVLEYLPREVLADAVRDLETD
ncbi:MAG: magnesium transporter, partial [Rhodobacteraceae bacterium]|nr:magnesium transporter [Paracoccaceae bacterium]